MVVIGLTGTIGSGKSEIANYLISKGFNYISLSKILREMAEKKGIEINRKSLQEFGNTLRAMYGKGYLAELALKEIWEGDWIIDSIKNPGEIEVFRKNIRDFYLIGIDAPLELRWKRVKNRGKKSDPKTYVEFQLVNDKDLGKYEPEYGQQVKKCIEMADFYIFNDGSLEELKKKVDLILKKIKYWLWIGWEEGKKFFVNPEIITSRSCILGQSGSGKSYLAGVIAEELARKKYLFVLVDIEGEYGSLKELGAELGKPLDVLKGKPIIWQINKEDEIKELEKLFKKEEKLKIPILIILEEADRFIPQKGEKYNIILEIAKRGRKRGLGLLIVTQRPAIIEKTVLAQTNQQFIGKLTLENDLNAIDMFFENRKQLKEVIELKAGEFFYFGETRTKIKVRKRFTKHLSETPKPIPVTELKIGKDMERLPIIEDLDLQFAEKIGEKHAKRKFIILGEPEEFNIEIYWKPFYLVRIREVKGKKFKDYTILFDAFSGKIYGKKKWDVIPLGKKIKFLKEKEWDVKKASKIFGYSQSYVRKVLNELKEQGFFIKIEKNGKIVYIRSKDISLPNNLKELNVDVRMMEKKVPGEILDEKFDIEILENYLKGLFDNIDIIDKIKVYKPIYKLIYKNREEWIEK